EEDLRRASRGDKDAAARAAERMRPKSNAGPDAVRFEAWMQYAAELGNGIAAYELARYYNETNRSALVGEWIGRAKKLGYTPPPGLRITRGRPPGPHAEPVAEAVRRDRARRRPAHGRVAAGAVRVAPSGAIRAVPGLPAAGDGPERHRGRPAARVRPGIDA